MPGDVSPTESGRPMYFIGCDMGGWHTDDGDALAVCKWESGRLSHVSAECGHFFYPVHRDGPLAQVIAKAKREGARVVVGIDAALAWPVRFMQLVQAAPQASHMADFDVGDAIDNPYLYRDTERFVKLHFLTGKNERPLTAPGDKFGNNSSKAQSLVAWLSQELADCYRPPFHRWCRETARSKDFSIIEVYPAASSKSAQFNELVWPTPPQTMRDVGETDIADAKRCSMTAVCYAATLHIITPQGPFPEVVLPDDAWADKYEPQAIQQEGWIFVPRDCKR